MSNPANNSLAAGLNGGEGAGHSNESDMGVNEELPVVGSPSPYNGSKSLVTGKRGFTPYFKSLAVAELSTHCSHQSLFTKALTVTESYEAVTICRIVALLQSNQVASLIKMS